MIRRIRILIHRLIDLVPSMPPGMTLYDRGDRYAHTPTLTARTQAKLLGAHIDFAGGLKGKTNCALRGDCWCL